MDKPIQTFTFLLFLAVAVGCGDSTVTLVNYPPQNDRVCCFGDSLVAGVGATSANQTYPVYLAELIDRQVTSWGASGDTTAQALSKCNKFENNAFGIVIVTIGGNDILQRIRWEKTEKNLRLIFQKIQDTGAVVVFTGVTGPLNPTRDKIYRKICKQEGVLFISEILDGIIKNPELAADNVHPNSKGYRVMATRIAESLTERKLLDEAIH